MEKFEVDDRVRFTKYKNIFYQSLKNNLKNNPWTYEIQGLNGEKIIANFYEKELLLSKL